MIHNGEFCHQSGLDWAQNSQFWSFCRFFPSFPPKSGSDLPWMANHPIHNFSQLLPPQYLIFGEISQIFILGGVHQQHFLSFSTCFESFHTTLTQNESQWPVLPPKWLGWAQNGQFWLNFNKHLNISAESQLICTKPSEQGLHFLNLVKMSPRSAILQSKVMKTLNISAESQFICEFCNKSG